MVRIAESVVAGLALAVALDWFRSVPSAAVDDFSKALPPRLWLELSGCLLSGFLLSVALLIRERLRRNAPLALTLRRDEETGYSMDRKGRLLCPGCPQHERVEPLRDTGGALYCTVCKEGFPRGLKPATAART